MFVSLAMPSTVGVLTYPLPCRLVELREHPLSLYMSVYRRGPIDLGKMPSVLHSHAG